MGHPTPYIKDAIQGQSNAWEMSVGDLHYRGWGHREVGGTQSTPFRYITVDALAFAAIRFFLLHGHFRTAKYTQFQELPV